MKVIFIAAVLAMLAGPVLAEDQPSTPKFEPVMASLRTTVVGTSFDSYCLPDGITTLTERSSYVFVTGIKSCSTSYSKREIAEIVFRGKKYYSDLDNLDAKESEINRLREIAPEQSRVYAEMAISVSKKMWSDDLQHAMDELKAKGKQGLTIMSASIFDVSEYTEGTGFRIVFFNPSKKTIKYVTTHLVGYNSVNDPVRDWRKKSTTVTVKGVGPISPGQSASYSYDYVWMTDLVESYKISSIEVQYMDGSKKVLKDPKKFWLTSKAYGTLSDFNKEAAEDNTENASVSAAAEEGDE